MVELVIYIALLTILLLSVTLFITSFLKSKAQNQSMAEVEQQGTQVAQIISQSIRNAENITLPITGGTAASLTLDVVTVANDPTMFSLSSGVIKMQEGAASAVDLTNSKATASGLSFYNVSRTSTPGAIKFQFTLTYNNYSKTFYGSSSLRY